MITATGIGSGLDIDGLVTQLVAAERAGTDLQLNRESSRINVELSAFASLKSSVSSFQSSLNNLNTLSNFSKKVASSSDAAVIGVSAKNDAVENDYEIAVSQLAEKHSLSSIAFSDKDSTALGTGTLTIRFGTTDYDAGTDTYNGFSLNPDSSTANITIDSTNNTLEGIMQAINEADIGVNASVVNDGTGYRLLLSSQNSGASNSLEISVNDDDASNTDLNGLSRFAFNASASNLEQSNAAEDALFTINGLAISNASNTVSDAIPGVTLSLKKVSADPVSVSVKDDDQTIVNAVNSFLKGYNQFKSTIKGLTSYDADKNVAGILLGDFTVRSITTYVDNLLRNNIEGVSGEFVNLAELGIKTNGDGQLELDGAKFGQVLTSNRQDVINIFTAFAAPDDPDIAFHSAGGLAQVGSYAVNITQLASAGVLSGSNVLPDFTMGGSVVIDANNDNFTLEVDGVNTGEITLTAGTYTTGEDLASEIQTQINGSTALRDAGKTVSVSYDVGTNSLSITSTTLGNSSTVNMLAVDTNTLTQLGFDIASGTVGLDIAGSIGGDTATGAGTLLTGATGTSTEGLNLLIKGSTTGSRGNVNFTRGLASQLDLFLKQILDSDEGTIESRIETLETRKDTLEKRREELELKWANIEERYRQRFNALDTLMSSLQSTSSYLETQLSSLPKPNSVKQN